MAFPVIPFLIGLGATLIYSGFKRAEESDPTPRPRPSPRPKPKPKAKTKAKPKARPKARPKAKAKPKSESAAPAPAAVPEPAPVSEAAPVAVEAPKSEEDHTPSAETEKPLDSEPMRSDNEEELLIGGKPNVGQSTS